MKFKLIHHMLRYLPYCQINGAVFIGDETRQCGLILSKVPSAIHLQSGSIEHYISNRTF